MKLEENYNTEKLHTAVFILTANFESKFLVFVSIVSKRFCSHILVMV